MLGVRGRAGHLHLSVRCPRRDKALVSRQNPAADWVLPCTSTTSLMADPDGWR
jgi:hypothetical protein